MSDKKNNSQPKQPRPVSKDTGTDYNKFRRNYDSGRPTANKSEKGTSGTGPRDKKE
jgi:hypothetical protein